MSNELKALLIEHPIRVKAYDIDAMGIVSNIVYVRWFEDLRMESLESYFPYAEMMESDFSPILAKTEIEYKYPVRINDKLIGRVWIHSLGKAKWAAKFEIVSETRTHCIGTQTGYFFDLKKNRPIPVPNRLRWAYEQSLEAN